jgi:hypothetical protein
MFPATDRVMENDAYTPSSVGIGSISTAMSDTSYVTIGAAEPTRIGIENGVIPI